MPAAAEVVDAEAILRRCISCFTHRHLKHDRERQQAALREAAIAVPFLRPRLCGQMAELLRLGRGIASSDSSDGNKGMCALLSAVASPPAALVTGADTRHSAEAAIHAGRDGIPVVPVVNDPTQLERSDPFAAFLSHVDQVLERSEKADSFDEDDEANEIVVAPVDPIEEAGGVLHQRGGLVAEVGHGGGMPTGTRRVSKVPTI